MIPIAGGDKLGGLGHAIAMPAQAGEWSEAEKTAWSAGFFAGISSLDQVEIKRIAVEEKHKVLRSLEIHHLSPQVYAVVHGTIAVPVSSSLDPCDIGLYRVEANAAIAVNANVWHGGPVAIGGPAVMIVVLRNGTTAGDTTKTPIDREIEL